MSRQTICEIKNGRNWAHLSADSTLTKQQAMDYLRSKVSKPASS